MFSRIQVSLDTTEFAELALPAAIELARRSDGRLDLVGVHDPVAGLDMAEWENAAARWMEEELTRVARRVANESGCPVEMHLEHGAVVPALLEHARASGADLMVVATHGRGALSRAWLGSVGDGFIRHSHIPLLLIRPDEEGNPPGTDFRRILVPMDGSEQSRRVLPLARKVARGFDAQVRLLRVVTIPHDIPSPYTPTVVHVDQSVMDESVGASRVWLEAEARALEEDGLEVSVEVVTAGAPSAGICDEASSWEADLIVMATHGRAGLERALLGSTADKVVRSTRTPVLITNPDHTA